MESAIKKLILGGDTKKRKTPSGLSSKGVAMREKQTMAVKTTGRLSSRARKNQPELRFSKLPGRAEAPTPYSSLQHFKGVVVPMGHGKTTLAREEGWIDIDALLQPRVLSDVRDEFLDLALSGATFEESSLVMAKQVGPALKLLNPHENVVFMAQSFSLLEALGIDCVGAVAVTPDVVLPLNMHRDEHERVLIQKNIEEVVAQDGVNGHRVHFGGDIEDVRWYIYCMCEAVDIKVSRPHEFDMSSDYIYDDMFKTSSAVNLETTIKAYDNGLIPKEVVHYQINANGLRSYRGMGFTWNDWARVVSYSEYTRGGPRYEDEDWTGWPVNLKRLSEGIPLEEHDDVQFLLRAHTGEHERFVLTLILHWKMLGMNSGIANKLFPLYSVRRVHWNGVFDKIREGVIASNTLLGMPLTAEERELVLSMKLLASGSMRQVREMLKTDGGSYPRRVPTGDDEAKLMSALSTVRFSVADHESKSAEFHKLMAVTKVRELRSIDWDGSLNLRERLIRAIGMELIDQWAGEKNWEIRLCRVLKSLAIRWYKACIMRDEWSDLACRLLEGQEVQGAIEHGMAAMLSCDIDTGTSGLDWGLRVLESLKSFMVCGMVLDKDGVIVMQTIGGQPHPCILGLSEAEIWGRIAQRNIPRSALGMFSDGVGGIKRLVEIGVWSSSKTVMMLEMINATSWMPKITDRMMLACLLRWKRGFCKPDEAYMFEKLASCYTQKILGRSYARIEDRLVELGNIASSDGGLECTPAPRRGKLETRDGLWTGHGTVTMLGKVAKTRVARSVTDMMRDYEDDDGASPRINTYGIHLIGLMGVQLVKMEGKGRLNLHCELVYTLANTRERSVGFAL